MKVHKVWKLSLIGCDLVHLTQATKRESFDEEIRSETPSLHSKSAASRLCFQLIVFVCQDEQDHDDEDPLMQDGVGIAMGKTAADGKVNRVESDHHNAFDALTRQQIEDAFEESTELPEKSTVVVSEPAAQL